MNRRVMQGLARVEIGGPPLNDLDFWIFMLLHYGFVFTIDILNNCGPFRFQN